MTDELNKLENSDYTPGGEPDETTETSEDSPVQTAGERFKQFAAAKLKGKRRAIIITTAGLGGITGGMIGFSLLQGPFQFIQIAGFFTDVNMGEAPEMTESRLGQMLRFNKALKDPENAELYRVGWVGRKLSGKLELMLSNRGVTTVYENSVLADLVDADGNSIVIDGKTFRDIENDSGLSGHTANLQRRNFLRKAAWRSGGVGKIVAAVGVRPIFRKAGISLKPLGNYKYDKSKSFFENLRAYRDIETKAIENGVTDTSYSSDPADEDATPIEQEHADSAADAVDGLEDVQDAYDSGGAEAGKAKLTDALKKGGMIVAIACAAQQLSDAGKEAQYVNRYLPLMRLGMRYVAIGHQAESGEDTSLDEMGLPAERLYDKKLNQDWSGGQSVMAVAGETDKDVLKLAPDMFTSGLVGDRAKDNALKETLDGISGFTPSKVCSLLSSDVAQVGFFLVNPVEELIEGAILKVLTDQFLDDVLRLVSGHPIDISTITGPAAGNAINYGTYFAGNEQARGVGGVPQSDKETAAWKRYLADQRADDAKDKGFGYRYFAFSNPYSLVSKIGHSLPRSFKQVANSLTNLAGNLGQLFGWAEAPFARVVAATASSDNYDFGVPTFGMALSTLNNPKYENPYENVSRLKQLIAADPDYDDINDLHEDLGKPCFNLDIKEGSGANPSLEITPLIASSDDGTNILELPSKCNSKSELFTLYRFYVLDLMTSESMNCYLGSDESCKNYYGESFESDTTGGSQVVGDPASLAKQILANSKITFTTTLAKQVIVDTAAGKPGQIESRCTSAPASEAFIDARILQVLLDIAKTHTVGVGYITNGCHTGSTSKHYYGKAVDLNTLDGRRLTGGDADRPFMQELTGILPNGSSMGEVNCSSLPITPINEVRLHNDTCNHLHYAVQ